MTTTDRRAFTDLIAQAWALAEDGKARLAVPLLMQAVAIVEPEKPARVGPKPVRRTATGFPVESETCWWANRQDCANGLGSSKETVRVAIANGKPLKGHRLAWSPSPSRDAWLAARGVEAGG